MQYYVFSPNKEKIPLYLKEGHCRSWKKFACKLGQHIVYSASHRHRLFLNMYLSLLHTATECQCMSYVGRNH